MRCGQLRNGRGLGHAGQDDGELVTAQARHQVALAHAGLDALRHLA